MTGSCRRSLGSINSGAQISHSKLTLAAIHIPTPSYILRRLAFLAFLSLSLFLFYHHLQPIPTPQSSMATTIAALKKIVIPAVSRHTATVIFVHVRLSSVAFRCAMLTGHWYLPTPLDSPTIFSAHSLIIRGLVTLVMASNLSPTCFGRTQLFTT